MKSQKTSDCCDRVVSLDSEAAMVGKGKSSCLLMLPRIQSTSTTARPHCALEAKFGSSDMSGYTTILVEDDEAQSLVLSP
mmetsp:Transcript_11523/g.35582  ORF Transcript_11523/g.35582 Transcript_11523/m.35582 type:complete len:80 (-) Transcript_11523:1339-1578(-)